MSEERTNCLEPSGSASKRGRIGAILRHYGDDSLWMIPDHDFESLGTRKPTTEEFEQSMTLRECYFKQNDEH